MSSALQAPWQDIKPFVEKIFGVEGEKDPQIAGGWRIRDGEEKKDGRKDMETAVKNELRTNLSSGPKSAIKCY